MVIRCVAATSRYDATIPTQFAPRAASSPAECCHDLRVVDRQKGFEGRKDQMKWCPCQRCSQRFQQDGPAIRDKDSPTCAEKAKKIPFFNSGRRKARFRGGSPQISELQACSRHHESQISRQANVHARWYGVEAFPRKIALQWKHAAAQPDSFDVGYLGLNVDTYLNLLLEQVF